MVDQLKNLLWLDDDSENRYLNEQYVIKKEGWQIIWAKDIEKGMEILRAQTVSAIILDQMVHLNVATGSTDIWGGCFLLYWLRGTTFPFEDVKLAESKNDWLYIADQYLPLDQNINCPAIVVSAYHHSDVVKKTKEASVQDKNIKFLSKPIDIDLIKEFLLNLNN